jgi:hypothetical protein
MAAGIGSLVLGIVVCLNELGGDISKFLAFDKNFGLGSGVGPLSGKVSIMVLAFVISWVVLHPCGAARRSTSAGSSPWP